MKILKTLGLVALLIIVGLLIAGLFVEKKVSAERSIVMDAPASFPFEQVNNLKNWADWGPCQKNDTTMKITLGEKFEGEGGSYSWVSENSGNGKLTILKSEPSSVIETKLEFERMGESSGSWKFTPDGSATKVTWAFAFEMPYPFNAMRLFNDPEKDLSKMFDEGLAGMKVIVEKQAADAAAAALQMQADSSSMNTMTND